VAFNVRLLERDVLYIFTPKWMYVWRIMLES